MSAFYAIAIICILLYMISVFKKTFSYKKMKPEDVITLNHDNWGIRNVCGTMLILMFILGGLAFGTLFRAGEILSQESLKIFGTLIFFIILYISLSSKTKVSSVGIFRNSALIQWSDINKINFPQGKLPEKFKVKVIYKNRITNEGAIEISFKNNREYDDFLFLVNKYSKFKVKANKYGDMNTPGKNKDNNTVSNSNNNIITEGTKKAVKANKKKKGSN